ncbi:MAG: IclR family transcriptional regulator [Betaproteobacteria bacterium]|nr:MAG: IclR family transcriptional regulator [Betaproteobacteria bacterium]
MAENRRKPKNANVEPEAGGRQFVIALARGLRVLQAYSVGDDVLTNLELAKRTGLPKPTISRLTHTLSRLGYLAQDTNVAGYRLQPHILTLGYPVLARLGARQIIRPMLQEIATAEGVTAAIATRDGLHMIFVERLRAPSIAALEQDVGTRVPIATTAIGRAYLAAMPQAARTSLLEEIRISGLPEWWPQIRAGVEREMARFEHKAYCFGGDWNAELNGVAVPLALSNQLLVSIACHGPRVRLSETRLEAIGARLKSIVHGLEKMPLGEL